LIRQFQFDIIKMLTTVCPDNFNIRLRLSFLFQIIGRNN